MPTNKQSVIDTNFMITFQFKNNVVNESWVQDDACKQVNTIKESSQENLLQQKRKDVP